MTTLGPMLLFRLRTIWKTLDVKYYPIRLIAQILPLLTTICSGRCRTPSLEYGSHQNRVSKIGLIHSWPPSRRSSFGMESTNCQEDGKSRSFRWAILWIILLYMFFKNKCSNFEKEPHELSYRSNIIQNQNPDILSRTYIQTYYSESISRHIINNYYPVIFSRINSPETWSCFPSSSTNSVRFHFIIWSRKFTVNSFIWDICVLDFFFRQRILLIELI